MSNKKQSPRYGIFYRSNGQWTSTPYCGLTFTAYTRKHNRRLQQDISALKNYILKSRIQIRRVTA